jgi:hypothetical protein
MSCIKGLYLSYVIDHKFQLYMLDDDPDKTATFETHPSAYLDEPKMTKRDWYDCPFPR